MRRKMRGNSQSLRSIDRQLLEFTHKNEAHPCKVKANVFRGAKQETMKTVSEVIPIVRNDWMFIGFCFGKIAWQFARHTREGRCFLEGFL